MWSSVGEASEVNWDGGFGRKPEENGMWGDWGIESMSLEGRSPSTWNGQEFVLYMKRNGKPFFAGRGDLG